MGVAKKPVTAKAHTNIALVKYWGKLDETLIIPQNASLSITLDEFYSTTSVLFDDALDADQVTFDDQRLKAGQVTKISHFMDHVRQMAGIKSYAQIVTQNHVPTAAGLASSASGFAALAGAASTAAGLQLDRRALSRLARLGSGSATRSIFGGFAAWQQGHDDETSYGYPIDETPDWDIAIVAVILTTKKKSISSREGMRLSVNTSPFYPAWVETSRVDFETVQKAITERDFETLGHTAEQNAMRMHALTLSADPSFTYFNADSLKTMQLVRELRLQGLQCYFTMDAGPNVKVICRNSDADQIAKALQAVFGTANVRVTHPGPGITINK
ncbi:mvaD protein [Secundilactobacillus odoratitofui DSM 19909 = JCM 15043]|uniref:diphosphomevalonate decarboxylase n=1 Tax=Secundilactobacillus odoratitofui DSM 19909 = JCM 15043 TaxID=1423776 RepID=A0A0R1LXU5_9LACO|nr:diphosphomevalonate decarboxylase [Secundilactobacillus odoratitofui]KRK98036.1 mvaD protein [Secundilactobacillus odoratitofui DSM 19909 = JCM 15043]